MLHSTRSMPTTMPTLHRLLGKSRLTRSGKVPTPTSVISRAFSQCPSLLLTSKTLSADIPVVSGPTINSFLVRSYATTTAKKSATKKKPATKKKTTTKKKAPAKKKAAAKKPKKVAKKKPIKKKVAKKPAKPTRPTVLAAPSARGLSGYVVYIQNYLKSTPGPGGPDRLSEAVREWRSLSDAEKQVLYPVPSPETDLFF
jgi:outer membrane biosynthesis protein TonB